jgi:large subunit ribosomal protein L19
MAATKQKHRKRTKSIQVRQKNLHRAIQLVENHYQNKDIPDFAAGDTLKVHVRIKEGEKERIQIFEGIVIRKANRGVHKSFTIRKISHGVGVERIFLESSPRIAKIEHVSKGKVRRSKLYYIRNLTGKAARIAKL